jgi:hypothetical protein
LVCCAPNGNFVKIFQAASALGILVAQLNARSAKPKFEMSAIDHQPPKACVRAVVASSPLFRDDCTTMFTPLVGLDAAALDQEVFEKGRAFTTIEGTTAT